MSENKKSAGSLIAFRKIYEKALIEHKKRARSMVEEETGGDILEENAEDIYEDAVEEHHQDVVNASDNLGKQAESLESEGKIIEQERREFTGITAPKAPPGERIKHIDIQMGEWKSNLEKETDDDRRQITQRAVDVTKQVIDDARLEMGQVPTILDKTLKTIPANISKLLNIDGTNFVSPSPPVQCCEQRRNNFW